MFVFVAFISQCLQPQANIFPLIHLYIENYYQGSASCSSGQDKLTPIPVTRLAAIR